MISVLDYGAVADYDTTKTDNFAAFQAAMDAAVAANDTLYIPSGSYYIAVVTSPYTMLTVNGNLTLLGDGIEESKLYFGPDTAGNTIGFWIIEDYDVVFDGLYISGPPSPTSSTWGIDTDGDGTCLVKNCHLVLWMYDYKGNWGGCKFTARSTKFDAGITNIQIADWGMTPVGKTVECQLFDCDFDVTLNTCTAGWDTQHSYPAGDPRYAVEHNMYLYQGVSLLAEDCRFNSQTGCVVWMYYGSGPCDYFIMRRCTIEMGDAYYNAYHYPPFVSTPLGRQAIIEDCDFKISKSGIWIGTGGVIVRNCRFTEDTANTTAVTRACRGALIDLSDEIAGDVVVDNCTFEFRPASNYGIIISLTTGANHTGKFIFNNCKCTADSWSSAPNRGCAFINHATADLVFNRCTMTATRYQLDDFAWMSAGTLSMNDCNITIGYRDILLHATNGHIEASFNHCKFNNTASGSYPTINYGGINANGGTYGVHIKETCCDFGSSRTGIGVTGKNVRIKRGSNVRSG